ncbi:MAG: prepilin-type N-terminal cleavage/methylation domain-containing protein, partial [Candidatus Binatia bacterium]
MILKFQVPSSRFQVPNPQSAIRNPQLPRGFSLLDLLIALMVLAIVLLAAVNQFDVYNKP